MNVQPSYPADARVKFYMHVDGGLAEACVRGKALDGAVRRWSGKADAVLRSFSPNDVPLFLNEYHSDTLLHEGMYSRRGEVCAHARKEE